MSRKSTLPGSEYGGTAFLTFRIRKLPSTRLGQGIMSARPVTTTCLTSVLAMTLASVWAKTSTTIIACAPESLSWCCNSRAVYIGFTLTTT